MYKNSVIRTKVLQKSFFGGKIREESMSLEEEFA